MSKEFLGYVISWVHGVAIGGGIALICADRASTLITVIGALVIGNSIAYFAVIHRFVVRPEGEPK